MKNRYFHIYGLMPGLVTAMTMFTIAQDESGFKPIFDGKTLEGWNAADMSYWSIEDDAITGKITPEHPLKDNLYLIWKGGELADFELKMKSRVTNPAKNTNSGFQFRSKEWPNHDVAGYQMDNQQGSGFLVRLYDEHGRHNLALRGERTVFDENGKVTKEKIAEVSGPADFTLEEWHEYDLICLGKKLMLKVNGKLMAETTDNDPKNLDLQGILGLQLHSGGPTRVQFKDIQLKIIKPAGVQVMPPAPAASASLLKDKTLVVWAAPANLTQKGGSALTIDDNNSHFDGIVFGEISAGKWMAGSDFYRRTHREQKDWPAETADVKNFVQVAIVYRGTDVTTYRNGKEYSRHQIKEPQAFGNDSTVVIGLRHLGAGDGVCFAGAIEDARIYNVALTVDQIAALKPDEASDLKPWAWWTFDDKEARDRTDRFKITEFMDGARVVDGKLLLDGKKGTVLCKAWMKLP